MSLRSNRTGLLPPLRTGSTAAHVCCDNGHETQDDLGIYAEPTALYTDYHFINLTLSPTLSKTSQTLVRIHTFLLGFLNLDFFRLDQLSFCLWSGATVLDNLAFRYVTTFFTILLLAVFIIMVKQNIVSVKKLTERFKVCEKLKKAAGKTKLGKMKFFNQAIVHGILTCLILSYTQYTTVSIQILAHLILYGEGGKTVGSVVRQQGSVERFGKDHLPYAIPALLVLIFLSLPPPLLLISYPLLWNIKTRLRRNEQNRDETTPWLIRKLLPLIDSFQGVFRDNRRMFAGLLFLWRVILATTFACSPNLTMFFLITGATLPSTCWPDRTSVDCTTQSMH